MTPLAYLLTREKLVDEVNRLRQLAAWCPALAPTFNERRRLALGGLQALRASYYGRGRQ